MTSPTALPLAAHHGLDEAVERLQTLTLACPIEDPRRAQLEAAWDRLASYALAARNLAAAGVSAQQLSALVERAWRDATMAYRSAVREAPGG